MIDFDFVEIGTSDFETLAQQYPNARGISVEPIKTYLDRLPERENLIKMNLAVVPNEVYAKNQFLEVYYVTEDNIRKYELGDWMKGCNSVGKPHDFHTNYYHDAGVWHNTEERDKLATTNLLDLGIVREEKIPIISWRIFMIANAIGKINILKTDTEGMDAVLLQDILNYYWDSKRMGDLPKTIHFEDNAHSDKTEMVKTKQLMREFGYTVDDTHQHGHDSYAFLGAR